MVYAYNAEYAQKTATGSNETLPKNFPKPPSPIASNDVMQWQAVAVASRGPKPSCNAPVPMRLEAAASCIMKAPNEMNGAVIAKESSNSFETSRVK